MNLQPRFAESEHFRDFWEQGTGRLLVEMSGAEVSFDDFERFAPLYFQSDELGDAASIEVFNGRSFPEAVHLISAAASGETPDLPVALAEIIRNYNQKPDWLNEDLLLKGQQLCQKAGASALMVLRDCSLMGGYAFAYLNKPLILTGALKKGPVKRLADTLDFWVNVTRTNAFKPHRKGFEFCLKTRLIHSYSRQMIIKYTKEWEEENWGKPINTWDMLATYMGFSLVFLFGLKKVNVEVSAEEEAGLFHLWKYIGWLIGIPVEFMPDEAQSATKQFYLWTAIQGPADEDSVHLSKSLLDENLESTVLKYDFQRHTLRYLHICMNHHFLDKKVNADLQIPSVTGKNIFPQIVRAKNGAFRRIFSLKKQIALGHKEQLKVLEDYLRTTKT